MRTPYILVLLLALALLAACNPTGLEGDPNATPLSPDAAPLSTVPPLNTAPAPTSAPADYPSPPTPSGSFLPEGYPVPPTLPPKYPSDTEGRIWIMRPLGVQCTEASTYEFPTINDAVRSLEDAGIEVFGAEVVGLMVCESCECPTSEHYRVQIGVENLATATQMGWTAEIGG
jgi:hypothetical protein